jgi:hypothetical protein
MVKFNFVKTLNVTNNSIFYSFIVFKNEILGFGRRNILNVNERKIKHIKLDNKFNIIEDNNVIFMGEDPRCFEYNNSVFVLDNTYNDMHLLDFKLNLYLKIKIDGKNISFINYNNRLYFIHFMKPFTLYELNMINGSSQKIDVENTYSCDYQYRGGTSGFKLDDNTYFGFGHKTYVNNDILKHDIFKWIINFENNKPTLIITDVEQPINSKNICDPTSIIQIDNKKYLFTAETDLPWFVEQDYVNNVYEIIDD